MSARSRTRFDFDTCKRDYVGLVDETLVQAAPVYDHIFLSRLYGKQTKQGGCRIRVSWRFNQEGRIDLIDTKIVKTPDRRFIGSIRHLLRVKEYNEAGFEKNWWVAEAYCLPCVPQEMLCFMDGFLRLPMKEKYQEILEEGHGTAELILYGLENHYIGSIRRANRQMPLSHICYDNPAIHILDSAAGLWPQVSVKGRDELIIEYKINRE